MYVPLGGEQSRTIEFVGGIGTLEELHDLLRAQPRTTYGVELIYNAQATKARGERAYDYLIAFRTKGV